MGHGPAVVRVAAAARAVVADVMVEDQSLWNGADLPLVSDAGWAPTVDQWITEIVTIPNPNVAPVIIRYPPG